MSVNVNEVIRRLSPGERKKVEDRAAEIIAEEMGLRDLRKARKLTPARVNKTLGVTQTGFHDSKSAATINLHSAKNGRSYGRRCAHCRRIP